MATYRPRNHFAIPEPCSASWEEMEGDARQRHCAACSCDVHNLAAMTARQIEALMADPENLPCVRIARYDNGTLLVADELRMRPSYGAIAGAAMAALVTISSVAGCAQGPVMGKMIPRATYSGQVLDTDGKPAAKSTVSLMRIVNGKSEREEAETDATGRFQLMPAPGDWQVEASGAPGTFTASERKTVKIAPGEQKAAGSIKLRRMTVTAGVPMMVPTPNLGKPNTNAKADPPPAAKDDN